MVGQIVAVRHSGTRSRRRRPGSHTFTAVAVDNTLLQGQSNAVTVNVTAGGNIPPTVSLTASSNNINLGAATFLQATAADPDGTVSKVVFYSNGTSIATVTQPPFEFNYIPSCRGQLQPDRGRHRQRQRDQRPPTRSRSRCSGTGGGGNGNNPPTVSLGTSTTSVAVGSSATLTATAADPDGIAKVEFYNGATLVATDTTAPYTYTFTPSSTGTFTLTARAYDTKGAYANSNTVTITATPGHRDSCRGSRSACPTRCSRRRRDGHADRHRDGHRAGATVTHGVVLHERHEARRRHASRRTPRRSRCRASGNYTFYATVTDSLGQINDDAATRSRRCRTRRRVATTDPDIVAPAQPGDVRRLAGRSGARGSARRHRRSWINDQFDEAGLGLPGHEVQPDPAQHDGRTATTQMPNGSNYPGDSPQADVRARPPDARDAAARLLHQRDVRAGPAPPARGVGAVADRGDVGQRAGPVVRARDVALPEHHVPGGVRQLRERCCARSRTTRRWATTSTRSTTTVPAPARTRVPNENYAREIMQLFSVDLVELNAGRHAAARRAGQARSRPTARPRSRNSRGCSRATRTRTRRPGTPGDRQAGPLLRRADGAVPDHRTRRATTRTRRRC